MAVKPLIRKVGWRVLGPPPQGHFGAIDTISPRRAMIDNAVTIVQHNTREAIKTEEVGSKGSLLGDYLEFGVFRGDTFIHAYRRAARLMPFMRFWAFDSFAGLPDLSGPDIGGEFHAGQFACTQETFEQNLRAAGIDMSRIEIVPGWFDRSLTPDVKSRLSVASIVYIDADLYASTVPVLNFLSDVVTTGTVLIFDDWFCFRADPARGVQRAWHEWLERNPSIRAQEYHPFGAYGKSFIIRATAASSG
jgi:O-methyltransferase